MVNDHLDFRHWSEYVSNFIPVNGKTGSPTVFIGSYRSVTEGSTEYRIQYYKDLAKFWISIDEALDRAAKILGYEISKTAFSNWKKEGFPPPWVRKLGKGKGSVSQYPEFIVNWIVGTEKFRADGFTIKEAIPKSWVAMCWKVFNQVGMDLKTLVVVDIIESRINEKSHYQRDVNNLINSGVRDTKPKINRLLSKIAEMEREIAELLEEYSLPDIKDQNSVRKHRYLVEIRAKTYLHVLRRLLELDQIKERLMDTIRLIEEKPAPLDIWQKEIGDTSSLLLEIARQAKENSEGGGTNRTIAE